MASASKRRASGEEHSAWEKRMRQAGATASSRQRQADAGAVAESAVAVASGSRTVARMDRLDENARARVQALVVAYEQMSQVERSVALYELVARSPSRQLSAVLSHIEQVIRVDFLQRLPRDLAMRILAYLDAPSLGRIAQVSRHWKELAEDDQLWRRMCIQHIGHRCSKCGWGLSTLSLKTINQYKAENKNLRYKALYAEKHRIARNWKNGSYRLRTFSGHEDGVMCVQLDEQKVVSGSYDCTIRVWDIETLSCVKVLRGHTRCVRCLQFDGTKIISGSMDHTIKVWCIESGECVRTLNGHDAGVICLHFDGKRLVSGSVDSTIKVWDIQNGECYTLCGHTDWVNSVRILEGDTLLSGSDDQRIILWDLTSREIRRVFAGHMAPVQSVQANHCHVVSASLDNTIKIWDLRTGDCVKTLFGHMEGVWCIRLDSLRIVSGSQDKCLKVWDYDEYDTSASQHCTHSFASHEGAINCLDLSESKVVTGSDDCLIKIWDFGK